MPPRTEASDMTAGRVGLYQRIGRVVVRWPWVVLVIWVAMAGALTVSLPTLTEQVQRKPVPILPANAPVTATTEAMTKAFQESASANTLIVVLADEKGLGPADEQTYRKLVDTLRADTQNVTMVQDFLSAQPLREILTSKDNKAWLLPVGVPGELGSNQSYSAATEITRKVEETVAGSTLTVNVTGPAATTVDMIDIGEKDRRNIEMAMAVMLLAILLIIYRNVITMMLPLVTIVVSLLTAFGVVSALANLGLAISDQTIVFLTAMMAGAGTDYAVFLISRYHDFLRKGETSDQAVQKAMASVGRVIAASAGTVGITFLGMVFTKLGVFSTVSIALAVAIAITFTAAITFLPAVLVLAGRRGLIKPRRDLTARFWRRSGIRIVRRPKSHLAASLVILIALGSCAMLVRYNYDDRKALPKNVDSSVGYAALERHFPLNQMIPQYLFIQSPNDLRTPEGLADLEQMAYRISQLPGVAMVRGITRPTGESLEQARLSYQAGEVGSKLGDGVNQIEQRMPDLDRLSSGSGQLADALGTVRGQVTQAITMVRGLVDALAYIQKQLGADKTFQDIENASKLAEGMRALGEAIGLNSAEISNTYDWAGPVVNALDRNPVCDSDPSCVATRNQLNQILAARDDGAFDKLADLGRQLRSTQVTQTLDSTAKNLRSVLDTATKALKSAGLDNPKGVQAELAQLQQGADRLADASRQIADGVKLMVDSSKEISSGLSDASEFLLAMKADANKQQMAGFYIPPSFLTGDDFKKAAGAFISADGHSVRYLVQIDVSPFSTQAMDLVKTITDTARAAQPNTQLEGASVSMAGYTVLLRDVRDYYDHDIRLIIVVTILVVLLILIVLLRAIVAPLYLIGSVIISYLSAVGIGVVMFQFILGHELHWSVPGLTFIVLVAVGADYNLLLISRIRDESPYGVRSGIIKTVGSTGGVITAAGVIFAASMFGLLFASITTIIQAGFIIGVGILLDTFLVRTVTVPAIATLMGNANWWPSKFKPEQTARRPAKEPLTVGAPDAQPDSAEANIDDEVTPEAPKDSAE